MISFNDFITILRNLGSARLGIIFGATTLLIGLVIFFSLSGTKTSMSSLYSNLGKGDIEKIATELGGMGIVYEVSPAGTAISVPSHNVLETRMKLAERGLPSADGLGYEIFDNGDQLGSTNFTQNINKIRAMEGELARTIRSLDFISQARVHLVLPQREIFSRRYQDPSASIILKTTGKMSKEAISAITHLVATAVPNLSSSRISIVNENGKVLARPIMSSEDVLNNKQSQNEEFRRQYEQFQQQRITEMLERIVGIDNVEVRVQVEMSFDVFTKKNEVYDPDSQISRSTQTVEETEKYDNFEEDDAVTVNNEIPDAVLDPENTQQGTRSQSSKERSETTSNYEISRKTETLQSSGGRVERLSIGVLLNYQKSVDESGATTSTQRTEEQINAISDLVASSVGINTARGDKINISNIEFITVEDAFAEEETGIFNLSTENLLEISEMIALSLVAILVVLMVLRPLVSRIIAMGEESLETDEIKSEPQSALETGAGIASLATESDGEVDTLIDLDKVQGRVKASSVKRIGDIIDKHPEEAVSILRNWLYSNQSN